MNPFVSPFSSSFGDTSSVVVLLSPSAVFVLVTVFESNRSMVLLPLRLKPMLADVFFVSVLILAEREDSLEPAMERRDDSDGALVAP